ncbi:hypothetical protein GCM10010911_22930 [Paenibacillus nasutitermitis]|uniref:Uncharacterized protein n=1 Tax=Paenibacillus nasutitermitis TaxID=1652958 RepID=A0A916YWH1_9BACL|nr:hypothetical protein GCM10010911_22930 [Paenibacillus nasutitermitis]
MPHNKSEKIHNQKNESSIKEPEMDTKPEKTAKRPPSLNGIDKR